MNKNRETLIKISAFFRWMILFAAAVVLVYLGHSYLVHDDIRFGANNDLFSDLWLSPKASRPVLLLILSPLFITFLLGVYWLQRLLACYQKGLFFSGESMHCYLWLVWLKVAAFVIEMCQTLGIGRYHNSLFENTRIDLAVDFGNITTILLMLLIVYLLKAARDLEAENQEFV